MEVYKDIHRYIYNKVIHNRCGILCGYPEITPEIYYGYPKIC